MAKFSDRCVKISGTTALYFSFFALGLCIAIPGPTLLDLQQLVRTGTDKIAFIYLARSSGCLIGSLIGGIVFDMVKKPEYLLVFCNLVMSLCTLAVPWCRSIEVLMSVLAVGGLAIGALDTGSNVLCLNIWGGKDCAPFFQALHFVFGLGSFLSPLIAEPFLSKHLTEDLLDLSSNDSIIINLNASYFKNSTIYVNETSLPNVVETVPSVTYAYTIIGGFALSATFLFTVIALVCTQKKADKIENDNKGVLEPNIIFTFAVIVLTIILLSVYCGIELGYGQMLATYAVKGNLKLSKSTGSFLTAVFWGTFTFSRGVSIILSAKFSPFTIVLLDLIITVLGSIILLAFSNTYVECLWVGTVLLGIGISSFFPSVISWIERYVNITNKMASVFVISGSAGEMVVPIAVSQFLDSFPFMFIYVVFGCAILGCVLTLLLWFVLTRKGEKNMVSQEKESDNENIKNSISSL